MSHLHHWLSNFLGTVDWSGFLSAELLLAVPTAFCLLVWLRSPLVRPLRRLMVTVAVLSLIGWAVVVGEFVRHPPENGFATFCALAFGWAYAWVIGVPVLLLSFLLRVIHGASAWFLGKKTGAGSCRVNPTVCIAILVLASLVVYPLCLCCRPNLLRTIHATDSARSVSK